MHRKSLLLLAMTIIFGFALRAQDTLPYKNPQQSIDVRVADLLSRMTLEEKFWQLYMIPADQNVDLKKYPNGIFGFQFATAGRDNNSAEQMLNYSGGGTAYETAKAINAAQRYFIEDTRLGIPIIAFDEALHGLVRKGATAFPQSIALAATFDTALMADVAEQIAFEVKERGIRMILSPVLNVAVDGRWGRVEETYGEDPFLVTQMALAYITAFEKMGVITTPKHFIANSGDGGRDSYPVQFSERMMEEVFYPPFKAVIQKGKATSLMTAYNSFNGKPCSQSHYLLTEKLKNEWGFRGFVISDAGATGGANVLHFTAKDYTDATKQSLEAGLDVIFQTSFDHYLLFYDAFEKNLIDIKAIDSAVARVLRAKFELGLFEHPYVDERILRDVSVPDLPLKAARESVVLLKNDHDILPLKKNISVAVIGTDAIEGRLGGYSREGKAEVTILEGIQNLIGKDNVKYAEGCGAYDDSLVAVAPHFLFHSDAGKQVPGLKAEYFNNISLGGKPVLSRIDNNIDFAWTLFSPEHGVVNYDFYSVRWEGVLKSPGNRMYNFGVRGDDGYRLFINDSLIIDNRQKQTVRTTTVPCRFEDGKNYALRMEFSESVGSAHISLMWDAGLNTSEEEEIDFAVQTAQSCDVAIVVAGIEEGEFRDRASLRLPGRQEEMIQKIASTGKPVIVVLVGGGPVVVTDFINNIDGLIDVWYPGDQGGTAVADVLFGDYNPAGRLPISFPVDEAQLPYVYYHKPTGRGDDYLDLTGKPMFPFGFGLSYTTFEYSDLKFSKENFSSSENTIVSFKLKNSGKSDGDEVVQLYIRDELASVARPMMELKGFQRVQLKAGESKNIAFEISPEMLSMLNEHMQRVVEPGTFRIMIGASANDIRLRGIITVEDKR
ncbi:MAG: beta-1,3-glucosyltransferase [Bacteroidetes bacterium GWF2_43_63]|nr:MAG: beta-1,3-glucosyltransferase [Bacteroidetes bacterium GWE2_42_42]OFY55272.1 MAG: beta-1,3-glucosyltransferase [Bacteroidetes bacterium GWF2_43_63]HBG70900.1 beta-1,3-glucosyltransferase [Bacteroidales bacterium]HCB63336.1 beta-1,3-glucosyltransferase [Bacteroidales bacterium]HCY23039.1 beta-1,3-glucosyltransferase [Bacteroidales bacterium]